MNRFGSAASAAPSGSAALNVAAPSAPPQPQPSASFRAAASPGNGNAPALTRRTFALVGNPNSGKTTLFNALTGLRQKVGNYPGVTVERKVGALALPDGQTASLLDLPGLYSLTPHSPDEAIARDVLLGYRDDTPRPDAVVCVVDAANLERNLYLASQIFDLGLPTIVVLTMTDTARQHGVEVDAPALERALGVPVVVVVASRRTGLDTLRERLVTLLELPPPPPRRWRLNERDDSELTLLSRQLQAEHDLPPTAAFVEALALLATPEAIRDDLGRWSPTIRQMVTRVRARDEDANGAPDISTAIAEARYADVERAAGAALHRPECHAAGHAVRPH
jgi:ferrous iron transport protein B